MSFRWFNAIHNGAQDIATIRGLTIENPIELGQYLAPEDELLECSIIGVFQDLKSKDSLLLLLIWIFLIWIV